MTTQEKEVKQKCRKLSCIKKVLCLIFKLVFSEVLGATGFFLTKTAIFKKKWFKQLGCTFILVAESQTAQLL